MIRGAGRTDFQQGDAAKMYHSIHDRLFALPDGCLVYPAHDYDGRCSSTIGEEKSFNTRIGGKAVEGTLMAGGPMLVAYDLPGGSPIKAIAQGYIKAYETKYGAGTMSTFGANTYDAGLLLQKAIPTALKKAKPGSVEFREALRDALEQSKEVVGAQGVFNMSAQNHNGMDQRARVMMTVKDGKWVLIKD